MDEILNGTSIKADFEAQVTAALMIQSNALIRLKIAARLCGIPKQERLRRIDCGTFPKPRTLSSTEMCLKVIDECLQLHGGYGYTDEYPILCDS